MSNEESPNNPEEDWVLVWGSEPGEFRRIPKAEYEAQYGPIISVDFHPSQLRELDPIAQAQQRVKRAFAIADQIARHIEEEAMSARTAADTRSTKAPEIEAAAADIATFYRYLTTHGVDKETARALTLQYQDDQMVQAAKIREGIAKPTPATPVAEVSARKA